VNVRWLSAACAASVLALGLGLALVWCNIERLGLAYEIKRLEKKIDQSKDLNAKLEVERDNLLSPYRLTGKARELGLRPAGRGEIRKLPPG
jgi:cell division protein FtsL